jgi:hypothetical protein
MKPDKARRRGFVEPSVDDGMIEVGRGVCGGVGGARGAMPKGRVGAKSAGGAGARWLRGVIEGGPSRGRVGEAGGGGDGARGLRVWERRRRHGGARATRALAGRVGARGTPALAATMRSTRSTPLFQPRHQ